MSLESELVCSPGLVARYRLRLVRERRSSCAEAEALGDSARAARFLHRVLRNEHQETMGCLMLDARQRAVGYHFAYKGTLVRVTVEPRGLLVPALLANAYAIIAFHNHPSGDPTPSAEDIAFTRRLVSAGEIVGVQVYDHLVIGDPPKYVSLRDHGYCTK